ncbi:MAG: hypothetical protein RBU29_13550, partial [bacterium]|nr:hypothetical protein [bacterium]
MCVWPVCPKYNGRAGRGNGIGSCVAGQPACETKGNLTRLKYNGQTVQPARAKKRIKLTNITSPEVSTSFDLYFITNFHEKK